MNTSVLLLESVGNEFSDSTAIDRTEGVAVLPTLHNSVEDEQRTVLKYNSEASHKDAPDATSASTHVRVAIGPQHFDLLKLVGEGAFGKVILVRSRLNKQLYAMKAISKKLLRKKNNMQYMKSERDILTKIHHPFIVTLWFAFQTDSRLFLVMDFLSGGELFFHLKRKGLILEPEARLYLAEMILAIEFLHTMGVVHRDLKPENVLLRQDGHVCLTDFGLAKEVGDNSQVRTLCGTSEYMAPEMLLRNGYTKAVDWWSLGALFFEMLAGKPPFTAKTPKELDRKILSDKPSIPPYATANAASLLKGLLEKDVNKRLGAVRSNMFSIGGVSSLKAHAFFADLDWHAVLACTYEPPIKPVPSDPLMKTDGDAVQGLTANFHEGFTGQCLSPSVIEETYGTPFSTNASPAVSPAISRTNSFDPSTFDGEVYADFEFVDPSFTCTPDQLLEFDISLSSKQQKSAKKKDHKAKLQEEKNKKALSAAISQQQAEEAQAEKHKEAERVAADKALVEKLLAERTVEITRLKTRQHLRSEWQEAYEKQQKRMRNASKKLKDVTDLEAKLAVPEGEIPPALTPEQRLKLRRKPELSREISACEGELDALRAQEADLTLSDDEIRQLQELEAEDQEEKDAKEKREHNETLKSSLDVLISKEQPETIGKVPSNGNRVDDLAFGLPRELPTAHRKVSEQIIAAILLESPQPKETLPQSQVSPAATLSRSSLRVAASEFTPRWLQVPSANVSPISQTKDVSQPIVPPNSSIVEKENESAVASVIVPGINPPTVSIPEPGTQATQPKPMSWAAIASKKA